MTPLEILSGYLNARRAILNHIGRLRARFVVTMMPHIWSPLLARSIKKLGICYATVIHDAVPHPGDPTAWATHWLASDADRADVILTLSRFVAGQLVERRPAHRDRVVSLFHPDLTAGSHVSGRTLVPGCPFRLLFFGRIMTYKGLPQLVDAAEMLRRDGIAIELGVVGAGSLAGLQPRLEALGAEVVNRWLQADEVAPLLARYDAMACHYVEASQSGVVALAFGNGLPVVATPVGGIAEQVIDGHTGVLAADVTTRGFADAVRRLIETPGLYDGICRSLIDTSAERSMGRFVSDLTRAVTSGAVQPAGH